MIPIIETSDELDALVSTEKVMSIKEHVEEISDF
jgi:hypothetical protein